VSKIGDAETESELRSALMGTVSRAFILLNRNDSLLLGEYMEWLVRDDYLTIEEAMNLLDTVKEGEEEE